MAKAPRFGENSRNVATSRLRLPAYRAQLATETNAPPSGTAWIHELDYGGYRVGCSIDHGAVRLRDARGRDCTSRFPELVAAAKGLGLGRALLDGEVVAAPDDDRNDGQRPDDAAEGARRGLTYFVFDLLYADGADLRSLPLAERKARCERLLGGARASSVIRFSAHFAVDGPTVFARACELGAYGIVSKRSDAAYRAGLNDDWRKTQCTAVRTPNAPSAPAGSAAMRHDAPVVAGVAISTPERSVYPELGITKLELAEYYAAVAERMLPYVANRPLTLVRCDKGVRSAEALRADCKFLRHEPGWHRWAKAPIRRVQIQEQKKLGEYLVVDSAAGLVALVQGDILEIHVWNATVTALEKPDRLVFDLDPGAAVGWREVVAAARLLRDELAAYELDSWVKLTGGKGLHVVVPFRAEHAWSEVFAFSRRVAEALVRKDAAAFTVEYGKAGRERKILVDYKRNHRAAVAVAAYSARARVNAPVSAPVSWAELQSSSESDAVTLRNVRERLERRRSDPWKDLWRSRQRLSKTAARGRTSRV